jgi:beta-glucanase (GH16 family)
MRPKGVRHRRIGALVALSSAALASWSCGKEAEPSIACDVRPFNDPHTPGWRLVWSDEFSGRAIDTSRWSHEVDCWGGGNNELQCYTERAENSFVRDGCLQIVARTETFTGPAATLDQREASDSRYDVDGLSTKHFTSARLRSKGRGDWTYGRIEARIRPPAGQGTWPAFWMLPTDERYGGWAASGEIDIMEAANLGAECRDCPGGVEDRTSGALHFGGEWPDNEHRNAETRSIDGAPPSDEFHVYAIEWRPDEIIWLVDDQVFFSMTAEEWRTTSPLGADRSGAPFDEDFHVILNLAIGGNYPESRNERGIGFEGFPKTMQVDWVRVYECVEGPAGCRAPE